MVCNQQPCCSMITTCYIIQVVIKSEQALRTHPACSLWDFLVWSWIIFSPHCEVRNWSIPGKTLQQSEITDEIYFSFDHWLKSDDGKTIVLILTSHCYLTIILIWWTLWFYNKLFVSLALQKYLCHEKSICFILNVFMPAVTANQHEKQKSFKPVFFSYWKLCIIGTL